MIGSLKIVLFVLITTEFCECDILFPKDTSTDFVFPPKLRMSNIQGMPMGHLRPLGWQRAPEGKVIETSLIPDPKTFWSESVKPKKPLVMRGGFNTSSECFTKWDDKFLKSNYGSINIEVTTKKPGKIVEPKIMTFKRFLLRYNLEDWYLVSPIPDEILHGIPAVSSLLCGTFREFLQEAEMWMSSGGTSSHLHYDADHNLHCLITGRKDFIMYDPKHMDRFDMKINKVEGTGYSKVDAEMVNVYKYPKIGKIGWKWTTLWPGDCIFIPAGHLHQVRSYGRSLSVTVLWTPRKSFNDTGCENLNITESVSLKDLNFVWKLNKEGQRVINTTNYNTDPEVLRHHLYSLLRDDSKLPRERFFPYFEKARNDVSREKEQTPHAAFRQLDLKKKNYLSAKDIRKLPEKLLERVANLFIRPEEDEDEALLKDEL